jgi:hypothetical protein
MIDMMVGCATCSVDDSGPACDAEQHHHGRMNDDTGKTSSSPSIHLYYNNPPLRFGLSFAPPSSPSSSSSASHHTLVIVAWAARLCVSYSVGSRFLCVLLHRRHHTRCTLAENVAQRPSLPTHHNLQPARPSPPSIGALRPRGGRQRVTLCVAANAGRRAVTVCVMTECRAKFGSDAASTDARCRRP